MKEIRKIIAAYDDLDHKNIQCAIASVVNVEHSSYRRIGARMLVRSDGIWVGGISGGCLEGDALRRSQQAIFHSSPSRVTYDTMDDDEHQIGIGLGCNGRIEVLFSPIDPEDEQNPIELLRDIIQIETPTVLLKTIDGSPALIDQRIPYQGDLISEPIADIPAELLNSLVQESLAKSKSIIHQSAQVKLLVEHFRPEQRLIIVGDNYDVNAFTSIAEVLGWEIFIVGTPKKLSKEAYQKAAKVCHYTEVDQLPIHQHTAVVLMTHDYNWDKKMLPIFISRPVSYIGMLGPKKRMEKMQADLPDIDLSKVQHFHSPVGLDIGAETPEEIALAIAAEIIAINRARSGAPLKYRSTPIHS